MIFDLLFSLLGIILTIFIVVGVHEWAHFAAARLLGIKVLRCSIGFGKALYTWHDKKGTEYVLAPIPLGGYVKLLDESEGPVKDSEKHLAFNRQPLYKRVAVVAAGPLSNLVTAVFLYWAIFLIGFKTAIPIIGAVEPHSIASAAQLKPQQEIVSIDGHRTRGWSGVAMWLIVHIGDRDTVTIETKNFTPEREGQLSSHVLNLESWQMNDLKPDPLTSLGLTPYLPDVPMIIGNIQEGSPAAASPLKLGDKILAVNNQTIKTWDQLIILIEKHPDEDLNFLVSRDHKKMKLSVHLGHHRSLFLHKFGFLGIGPHFELPDYLLQNIQYGPLEALGQGFKETLNLSYINLLLFGKLITNKLSFYSLGGPITIFQTAGSAFKYGVLAFLGFLAFLNVALGIVNFFPIPGLDGGHLLFQFIEAIIRRPLSIRTQTFLYRLGFIFLICLLVQALTNDMLRLWG
jgi:regulator of sigma E protease